MSRSGSLFANQNKPQPNPNQAAMDVHNQRVAQKKVEQDTLKQGRDAVSSAEGQALVNSRALSRTYEEQQKARNAELMGTTQQGYSRMDTASSQNEQRLRGLLNEANTQSANASKVYQNLSTRMDDVVNRAESNAKNAMTLQQYMDPTNSQAFKNANQIYQTQAQNEGRQGLADFGVMSALGAQGMGAGMAGLGPLTAGQQMGLLAQSQRQAGSAYANTQRRMQELRDQGLQQGFDFHNKAYNAGLEAQDRYSNSMLDREGLTTRNIQNMSGLRAERAGFGDSITGEQFGRAQRGIDLGKQGYALETGLAGESLDRNLAFESTGAANAGAQFDRTRGAVADMRAEQLAREQAAAQRQASRNALLGNIITGGATMAGAALGGPLGAAAANRLSSAGTNSMLGGNAPVASAPMFAQPPSSRYGLGLSNRMEMGS